MRNTSPLRLPVKRAALVSGRDGALRRSIFGTSAALTPVDAAATFDGYRDALLATVFLTTVVVAFLNQVLQFVRQRQSVGHGGFPWSRHKWHVSP